MRHREPSFVVKRGSFPLVALKIDCASLAVIVQPSVSLWQLPHERPLKPSATKNGLVVLIVPAVLSVSSVPLASVDTSSEGPVSQGSPAECW